MLNELLINLDENKNAGLMLPTKIASPVLLPFFFFWSYRISIPPQASTNYSKVYSQNKLLSYVDIAEFGLQIPSNLSHAKIKLYHSTVHM